MSAVPVPALVVAGTSDLPSSFAVSFSAKAGPARATAAPSVSVASKVLFGMVLSPLTSQDRSEERRVGKERGRQRAGYELQVTGGRAGLRRRPWRCVAG